MAKRNQRFLTEEDPLSLGLVSNNYDYETPAAPAPTEEEAVGGTPPPVQAPDPEAPDQSATEGTPFFGNPLDWVKSVFRGGEEAAHDFYGLLDWAFGDILPDWTEERIFKGGLGFGEAESSVGSFIEGVSQFLVGFLATGGIGKALGATKALTSIGTKVFSAPTAAAVAAGAKASRGLAISGNMLKGAVTDMAFFDEHEERLSNMIQDSPLANPVNEFLAASDDDGVAMGRFKNAIEGAGLGVLADGLLAAIRKIKAGRGVIADAAAEGKAPDPAAVEAAMKSDDPIDDDAVAAALRAKEDTAAAKISEADAKTVADEMGLTVPKSAYGPNGDPIIPNRGEALEMAARGSDTSNRIADAHKEVAPRDMNAQLLAELHLKDVDWNMKPFRTEDGATVMYRAVESVIDPIIRETMEREGVVSLQQMADEGMKEVADILRYTDTETLSWKKRLFDSLGEDKNDLIAITRRVYAAKHIMMANADRHYNIVEALMTKYGRKEFAAKVTDAELADLVEEFHLAGYLGKAVRAVVTEQARGLVSHRIGVSQVKMESNWFNPDFKGLPQEDLIKTITDAGGRKSVIDHIKKAHIAMADPTNRVAAFAGTAGITPAKRKGIFAMTFDWWIHAILGGAKTNVVNTVANTTAAFYRSMEHLVGAGLRLDTKEMYRATKEMQGLVRGFLEMGRLWRQSDIRDLVADSFKTGDSQLGGVDGKFDVKDSHAITTENLKDTFLGKAAGFAFGGVNDRTGGAVARGFDTAVDYGMRWPTKLLAASDTMTKQIVYRATTFADMSVLARERGLRGAAAATFVADNMQHIVRKGQAYSFKRIYSEGMAKAMEIPVLRNDPAAVQAYAEQYAAGIHSPELQKMSDRGMVQANEVTMTELAANSPGDRVGKILKDLRRLVPITKLFIPFVTTPVNILKFANRRVGLDPIVGVVKTLLDKARGVGINVDSNNRMYLDLMSGNAQQRSDAIGRLAFGTGTVLSVATYAANAYDNEATFAITGKGPADPLMRAALKATGWQEYSIKSGNTYISYARADPFATMVGIVADLTQYAHFNEEGDDVEGILGATLWAVSNNISNKTYLTGISNLVEILQGQDPAKIQRILQTQVASMIPNSLGQSTHAVDTELKEIRGFADAAMAKVPWYSGEVEARRNVLGEVVNRDQSAGADTFGLWMNAWMPITASELNGDPVLKGLADAQHAWRPISHNLRHRGFDIDLREYKNAAGQTAIDRYREISSTNTPGGRTVRDRLERAMATPGYQALPAGAPDHESPNLRAQVLGPIINAHRQAAKAQLFREFPSITAALRAKIGKP